MLIRESPILARYAEEFQGKPAPLEKDKVYHLKIDLRSTAIILDKGHRLGVLVTSSSQPQYEVHPNTFNTVASYDQSPVAHQSIHLSARYPSSITLPVIAQEKK
jgi:predicted acyl esterase